MIEDDTFNHKKIMYECDESKTYKNVNLKNDESMCFEEDQVLKHHTNRNYNNTSENTQNGQYQIQVEQSTEPPYFQSQGIIKQLDQLYFLIKN